MAHRRLRLLFFAFALAVIAALSGGQRLTVPSPARAQTGDDNASFDDFSPVNPPNAADTRNPPRLYAGDFSHPGTASANLSAVTNGYCVTAHTQGLVPVTAGIPVANVGFTLEASNDQANWAVIPGILSAAGPSGVGVAQSPSTNGDVYCAIVRAPANYTSIRLRWSYTGSSSGSIASDPIPVRSVTLRATALANIGTVCTTGWDSSFLTGHQSNTGTTLPDPLDSVANGDWSVSSASVSILSVQRDPSDSTQWCVTLKSSVATPVTTNVTVAFDAVYNRMTNLDDQAHTAELGPTLLTIPGGFSLAHIGAGGEVLTQQLSPPLVTGSREVACIIGSDATANMLASGMSVTNVSGADQPITSGLTIFHATGFAGPGSFAFHQLNPQVSPGTLCFSFTSAVPGEQLITATFTDSAGSHRAQWSAVVQAGQTTVQSGSLIVQWNRIDRTDITGGGLPEAGTITYTTTSIPVTFVVPLGANAGGSFTAGAVPAVEWVHGNHQSNGRTPGGFLQGAVLHAVIDDPSGQCGHFLLPAASGSAANPLALSLGVPALARVSARDIWGFSIGGRFSFGGDLAPVVDDLRLSIGFATNGDTADSCSPGTHIRVKVDVYYPGQSTMAKPAEFADFLLSYTRPTKIPRLAWAGQVVRLTYAFSGCPAGVDVPVVLSRSDRQRGTFVQSTGLTVSGSSATGVLNTGNGCSVTALYTSPDPGEVDIQAMIDGNGFSKQDFPIFFMAIEDVVASAPPTLVVSEVGDVTATVRGYFVGSNPSGRPAETKSDGRKLPADRWVIPDDWSTLQGMGDFRGSWPSPDLPSLDITFFMQDETVVNSFSAHIKNGGVGWMMPWDTPDEGGEANSEVGKIPDAAGNVRRDRSLLDHTDTAGVAAVDIFGDYNLSFEGCTANALTGSPHCKLGDVVGHTRYYAVADYPQNPGKQPQATSAVQTTEWTWGGFKQVTVINTDDPTQKYIVAHLMDRDGYCDAASWNNTLGVRVQFQIDSGDGIFVEAQGQPAEISANKRTAWATTYDTVDDLGNKVHEDIAKKTVGDGECQAWVKVSDSLLSPVNVVVTFPSQPAPIPGDIRITGLVCAPGLDRTESITLTNRGKNVVSLDGFALRSRPADATQPEQHFGLTGLLAPGASVTVTGGPDGASRGWLPGPNMSGIKVDWVMNDGAADYMRLVWNNFEINRAFCDGTFASATIASPLPPDGEGVIVLDLVVPFGLEKAVLLEPGWNLVRAGQPSADIATAFAGHEADLIGVYLWDPSVNDWKRYTPGVPVDPATAITVLEKGQAYWVAVKRAFTITLVK